MKKTILLTFLAFSNLIFSQTLNPSFGSGGIVTNQFSTDNPSSKRIFQSAKQSDDKLVVIGTSDSFYSYSGFIGRLNPNGTVDYSFGSGGIKSSGVIYPSAVAIQNDDKIIVAGRTNMLFFAQAPILSRFNADGTVDNTFSCLQTTFPSIITSTNSFYTQSIAVQNDGKILIGGYIKKGTSSSSDFDKAIFRLNSNGSFDSTFSSSSIYVNNSSSDYIYSIALQSDGKIITVGSENGNISCTRLNSDGTFDTSFGVSGTTILDLGSTDVGRSVALQNDGNIIISGISNGNLTLVKLNPSGGVVFNQVTSYPLTLSSMTASNHIMQSNNVRYIESSHKIVVSGTINNLFTLFQFDDNGNLDSSFGTSGVYSYNSGITTNSSCFLNVLSNGNIVTGGSSYDNTNYAIQLAQVNANGTVLNANAVYFLLSSDAHYNAVEQNDGKLLVATNSSSIVRYNANGTVDTSFGTNGILSVSGGLDMKIMKKLNNGKILFTSGGNYNSLTRLNPDGTVDSTFGVSGVKNVSLDFQNVVTDFFIDSFSESSNGKIYLAFEDGNLNSSTTFYIARLNSDGSVDTTFGTNGYNSFLFPNTISDGWPVDIVEQNNGKIVVMGLLDSTNSSTTITMDRLGICRFNNDGTLDTSFNGLGYITYSPENKYWPTKMIKLSDDSFFISDRFYDGAIYNYNLKKFTSEGILDTSFGVNGILHDNLNNIYASEYIVLPNNKILKAGTSSYINNNNKFRIVSYNPDGSLDTSFGTNGYLTTTINSSSSIYNLLLLQNGNLLATGASSTNIRILATMAEYNMNNLDVEEYNNNSSLYLYPNPTHSKVYFNNVVDNFTKVSVCNVIGQEILKLDLVSNSSDEVINIENLLPGIYFLNFTNSEKSKKIKIIKE
jgi:uncharacterized delta-60 repeat protein